MSKRNRREHGRILSVETKNRGDSLADDFAAGVTSITVNDAGDFDEDGGWLYIGAQTVEYLECDDDTGVITLADPLTAAVEQGDPVSLWSDLYDEVVDYQLALVELDGDYDNPDPVAAEVAEGVGELPEGDRGKAGESCTLKRVAEDEWEVVAVGGRSRRAKGFRFEDRDTFTAGAAGTQTFVLQHVPEVGSVHLAVGGAPQTHDDFTVDYSTGKVTIPDDLGLIDGGEVFDFRYAYLTGVRTNVISTTNETVPFQSAGWKYRFNSNSDGTSHGSDNGTEAGWSTAAAPFGSPVGSPSGLGWPAPVTAFPGTQGVWLLRTVTGPGPATVSVRGDDTASVWWNGVQILDSRDMTPSEDTVTVPSSLLQETNTIVVHITNFSGNSYADVQVTR